MQSCKVANLTGSPAQSLHVCTPLQRTFCKARLGSSSAACGPAAIHRQPYSGSRPRTAPRPGQHAAAPTRGRPPGRADRTHLAALEVHRRAASPLRPLAHHLPWSVPTAGRLSGAAVLPIGVPQMPSGLKGFIADIFQSAHLAIGGAPPAGWCPQPMMCRRKHHLRSRSPSAPAHDLLHRRMDELTNSLRFV